MKLYDIFDICSVYSECIPDVINLFLDKKISYFDFNSKAILEYAIEKCINFIDSNKQSEKQIIVVSCNIKNNWRSTSRLKISDTFTLNDDGYLSYSPYKLFNHIYSICRLIKEKTGYYIIQENKIDAIDISKIIERKLGKSFCLVYDFKYDYLKDNNNLLHYETIQIPAWLEHKIECKLKERKLII